MPFCEFHQQVHHSSKERKQNNGFSAPQNFFFCLRLHVRPSLTVFPLLTCLELFFKNGMTAECWRSRVPMGKSAQTVA